MFNYSAAIVILLNPFPYPDTHIHYIPINPTMWHI